MNYYQEGRQARREGKYDLAWDLYSKGTDAGCLECAFELVVWAHDSDRSHPQAYNLCNHDSYDRFMCREFPFMLETYLATGTDLYIRGMLFRYIGNTEEANQKFYLSWKKDGNPHSALEYLDGENMESLEFAASEGLHEAQIILALKKQSKHLFLNAIEQYNSTALSEGARASFGYCCGILPENWRYGATITIMRHCKMKEFHDSCVLTARMEFRVEKGDLYKRALELYEYGKFFVDQEIPVCVEQQLYTTEAVRIYRNTKSNVHRAVLYWLWTRVLPRDMMRLIGQKYVWDTSHDDPNVWDF